MSYIDTYTYIIVLGIGIYVLVKSGLYIVRSLGAIARYFNISEFAISFILMAFATSIPELAVGINAAISKESELALGNVVGTNIINLSLIMGIIVLISGKVVLDDHPHFIRRRVFNFLLIISPLILLLDGNLDRIDGIILILLFLWNAGRMFRIKEMVEKRKTLRHSLQPHTSNTAKNFSDFFKNVLIFIASNIVVLFSAYIIVWSASGLSFELGIPEILIGLFVIGVGTSLPELTFGVRTALSGSGGMSLGNLFGSAVLNSTLVLGITAIINPIVIESGIFLISSIAMVLSILVVYYFLHEKDYLNRKEGLILIFFYIVFIIVEFGQKIFF